uniref:Uncharacterized protein n=1 Tax=Arundo donax TaxID=35708 RepID=A0A0A9AEJ7_ARUDO
MKISILEFNIRPNNLLGDSISGQISGHETQHQAKQMDLK